MLTIAEGVEAAAIGEDHSADQHCLGHAPGEVALGFHGAPPRVGSALGKLCELHKGDATEPPGRGERPHG